MYALTLCVMLIILKQVCLNCGSRQLRSYIQSYTLQLPSGTSAKGFSAKGQQP